ncbi:hypothetical protein KURONO_1284 [Mycobacterium tuberculosis str. Kurono]|nr:hypothetical protein KURONO_1284 [Mycobacterium tuberculosis str. Kurono]
MARLTATVMAGAAIPAKREGSPRFYSVILVVPFGPSSHR